MDVVPRSDMASMAHPIFSLSTRPDTRTLRYVHDDAVVEIQPSAKGLATIFDKDVLIYCISKLMHMRNHGEEIGPVVRITTHDMLVSTNRQTGGIMYRRIEDVLDRLAGTRIKTNVKTGDEVTTQNFGLIEWYDYNRKGSGMAERLRYLDLKLSDWMFRAVESAEVLPISRDYFRLRRPIDRRLYELARKQCGRAPTWKIGMALLQKKIGSQQDSRSFALHLRGLAASNDLPDFEVKLNFDTVIFTRRDWRQDMFNGASQMRAPSPAPRLTAPASPADASDLSIDAALASYASAVAANTPKITLSWKVMEQVSELAPRWDKDALEKMYVAWASGKDAAINEDARFLSFVKRVTNGKPPP